jgi:2-phosphosulfolactate phosphatase
VLAVGRRKPGLSLSPASLLAVSGVARLVLPSPNGSTIAASAPGLVVAGCLRNRSAVAAFLRRRLDAGASVAVVAAGERWPSDDSLRPCAEDLWGAGAILAGLDDALLSPEARLAARAWAALPDVRAELRDCSSGRELVEGGYGDDVEVAADVDADEVVPVLRDGAFSADG